MAKHKAPARPKRYELDRYTFLYRKQFESPVKPGITESKGFIKFLGKRKYKERLPYIIVRRGVKIKL